MKEKLEMNYIGHSEFDYPAYKDNKEKVWLDINYGSANGNIELYSSSTGDLAGEPMSSVHDVYKDAEIVFGEVYKKCARSFDYQMLSRYQSDCDYFLGYGNGYEGHLYFHDVEEQISEMKKLWSSFADNEKPEWLSMEDIEKYHADMKAKLKERMGE